MFHFIIKSMRKTFLIISSFLLLCACNDNMSSIADFKKAGEQIRVTNVDTPFSFDSVINPAVWRTYRSHEEKQAACQVPEEILKNLPTKDLVQVCMSYPLYGDYLAYNNELDGIKAIIEGFNGFAELQRREDAVDNLLAFYEKMDIGKIAETALTYTSPKCNELSILHVGYIELILCSGIIPELYSESNISRLETICNMKYKDKLHYSNVYSLETVKKSLLLGAQIKLKSTIINPEEKFTLCRFVQMGGEMDALEDYTKVSQIISK